MSRSGLRSAGILALPGFLALPAQAAPAPENSPDRIPALSPERDSALSGIIESAAWEELRSVWAVMTSITQPDSGIWYAGVIEPELADSLRTRILECFDEISTPGSPVAGEITIMRRLCMLRVQSLLYGSRSMMTRMILPAAEQDAEIAMQCFERRLDAIEELRTGGMMDALECSDAFAAAVETAMASLILDTLSTPRLYYGLGSSDLQEASWELVQLRLNEIRAFSDTASSIGPEMHQQALAMLSAADSVRSLLPGIGILLTDLICAR